MADKVKQNRVIEDNDPEIASLRRRVNVRLSTLVLKLEPSANAISVAVEAFSSTYGFSGNPPFLDEWTKHGPLFISSADMRFITDQLGIERLNNAIEKRLEARARKACCESIRVTNSSRGLGPTSTLPMCTWICTSIRRSCSTVDGG